MSDKNNPPDSVSISYLSYDIRSFSGGTAVYRTTNYCWQEYGDDKELKYTWDEESSEWVMIEMREIIIKKGFWASLVAWTGLDQVMETRWDCMPWQREAA